MQSYKRFGSVLFSSFFAICLMFSCESSPVEEPDSASLDTASSFRSGALGIKDSIEQIIAKTNFLAHPYETSRKLSLIEERITRAQQEGVLTSQMYIGYASTLLEAGQSQKAIDIFEDILQRLPANKVINEQTKGLHEALALSYLRLGEQRNCIENHTEESCIFPIQGSGVHTAQEGSQKAILIYKDILAVFPDEVRVRWLLNLAYMTIGGYPNDVPPSFLIPPSAFQSDSEFAKFPNIAMHLGVDVNDLAGGVILDDFNNDGLLDIIASSWDMSGSMKYFVNKGDGTFVDQTSTSGLDDVVGGLNLIQADFNNDGHLDFYILRSAWSGLDWMGQLPNSMIQNNGDGTFSDITVTAGLYDAQPSQAAVWFDYNTDGWLDLFVSNETASEQELHPCQLFLNQKDGTFIDVAPKLGLNITTYVKGVNAGDVNNDNLPDLYISSINGANKLFLNRGGTSPEQWKFEDVSKQAGVEKPIESFPTWFFDYNNDGFEDIFVASFDQFLLKQQAREVAADYLRLPVQAQYSKLYQNDGKGAFVDVTGQAGLNHILPAMGANYGDLDNDGYSDFYLGTGAPDFRAIVPNRMFRNLEGKRFSEVTFAGGFGHIQKGHGISFADLDNDGDQDIYAVMGGSVSGDIFQNALFENPGNENQWVTIRLRGTSSNRSAIGARIKIQVAGSDGSTRNIYGTVNSGGSFGANSLQAEIGLGEYVSTAELSIDWPDGKAGFTDYGQIPLNSILQVVEGQQSVEKIEQAPFQFPHTGGAHHH